MLGKALFEAMPGRRNFCRHQAVSLRGVGLCDRTVLPHPPHHIHPVIGLHRGTLSYLTHPAHP
jgi:hypothetical protein